MVDTPFFDRPPRLSLAPDDVARSAVDALSEPGDVELLEIAIRPVRLGG